MSLVSNWTAREEPDQRDWEALSLCVTERE